MEIRRFQPGDGPAVRAIDRRAMRETPEYVPDAPNEDLHDVPEHYFEDGDFLVGVSDENIVAMAAYAPVEGWKRERCGPFEHPVREVTRVRVLPECQQRGYGRALVCELERRARAAGVAELVLDTGADNAAAREFYESLGCDCDRTATVDFGEVNLELVIYRKRIPG